MKYIKRFENISEEEYERYINKFSVLKFLNSGSYNICVILDIDEYDTYLKINIYDYDDYNNEYQIDQIAIDHDSVKVLASFDTLKEAEKKLNIISKADKYNL